MTQEQLAEAAGISVDFVSLIERGLSTPSFATISKLASALNVSEEELFGFSEDKGRAYHAGD